MKLFKEYPATHSMSTSWFAIDEEGKVAILNFEDNGPIPQPASGSQTGSHTLITDGLIDSNGFKYREYSDEQVLSMFQEDPKGFGELYNPNDNYFFGYIQIDSSKANEFLEVIKPFLNDEYCSIVCYSQSQGIFSFDIKKNEKDKLSALEQLKSSNIILKVLRANFDYDCIIDDEDKKRLSPIPFFVYNQEYGDPFGDLNKVYTPTICPYTEDRLTDYERAAAFRIKGRFEDLAHVQPATEHPFSTYEHLDWVDIDGVMYYKMRQTGNTDEEVYAYSSLTSGLRTDKSHCENCPIYDKNKSSYFASFVRGWEEDNYPTIAVIGYCKNLRHELSVNTFNTSLIQCHFSDSFNEDIAKHAKEVGEVNVFKYCNRYFEEVLRIFRPYALLIGGKRNKNLIINVYPHTDSEIEIDGCKYPYFIDEVIESSLERIMEFANMPYRGKVVPKVLSAEEAERIGVKVEYD